MTPQLKSTSGDDEAYATLGFDADDNFAAFHPRKIVWVWHFHGVIFAYERGFKGIVIMTTPSSHPFGELFVVRDGFLHVVGQLTNRLDHHEHSVLSL